MKKELLVITDQHAAVKLPFGCALTAGQAGGVNIIRNLSSFVSSLGKSLYC